MAEKMIFMVDDKKPFVEIIIDYLFVPGFAPVQRKKNVTNLFYSIKEKYPMKKVLEVSTKSDNELGKMLSAFSLKMDGHFLESIFQSSKVFDGNIQYTDLLDKKPSDAKKFIYNLENKKLICFRYNGEEYPLKPESLFYDYMYVRALYQNKEISSQLVNYDIFTDIEFNYKKSINCQARSCAIFVFLYKNSMLEKYINDLELFKKIYGKDKNEPDNLFDL